MASFQQKPILLVPCAGFGRRVGSPLIKELLPAFDGGPPLIEYSLKIAIEYDYDVHVITRSEKSKLNDFVKVHLAQSKVKFSYQEIEPSREWPDSLLQSKPFWRERNLVILPDTEWKPISAIEAIAENLLNFEASYGVFESTLPSTWGHVASNGSDLRIIEKPQGDLEGGFRAWGLMGFQKDIGGEILEAHLSSTLDHRAKKVTARSRLVQIDDFRDLTRGTHA